ncbi:MAG: radical SAM protein [Deltaproteobacteria bacterium]|nr:MAG: radical SAM protein [Deltaproteobacteria bacterium]
MNIVSTYREILKKEQGFIKKKRGNRLSVALIYPNLYHIGMSSLGFQVVYGLLNKKDGVVAERFFLPSEDELLIYKGSKSGISSLESQIPLNKFDLIAFSLSFENDYINVLKILELGKIPLMAEERESIYPIVLAGGVATFLNPEPLSLFIDIFVLGEAEENLERIIDLFIESRNRFTTKKELLLFLARNEKTLYVPQFYQVKYNKDGTIASFYPQEKGLSEKIKVSKKLHLEPVACSSIISPDTEFANRILIEVARGCGRSCRFCAAGYVYRPPRHYEMDTLISTIASILKKSRYLGLLSASISDVPGINNIMDLIHKKGGLFSISSVRADSITNELLEQLKRTGQRQVTIAPDAGSERLRKVINKHLDEETIIKAVSLIAEAGLSIKLYFIIGLPTEEKEDIKEILRLIKLVKHHMVRAGAPKGRVGNIRINISCFIPKPFTPFQWLPMDDIQDLKEKQKWLYREIKKEGGIKTSFDVPKWAYVQSLLSLGDRRVSYILLLAHRFNGNWKKAFKYSEINPDFFVYRNRDFSEILPWDLIDHGIDKKYLEQENKKALSAIESSICYYGVRKCKRCGICGSLSL